MTPDTVVQILRQTLMTAFWLAAPLLAIGFVAGIVISLVQIATSMQDTAFSTIPRLVAFLVGLCCCCRGCCKRPCRTPRRCWATWAAMPASLTLSVGTLYAFLLVLARVAGALVFVPLPGIKARRRPGASGLRAWASPWRCLPLWPHGATRERHAAHRLLAGPPRKRPSESPSECRSPSCSKPSRWPRRCWACRPATPTPHTIDPNTEADSGILLVFAQLVAGLLFFALGLDREDPAAVRRRAWTKFRAGAYVFGPHVGRDADPPGVQACFRWACGWRCRWWRCW